ncbi:ABC transporter ATP-binding protein/permease [Eubacterium sp. 1001713B170207_170306_E7]|uniref:ABC transporter ATP-binding protein/permease n=1 Tax=Eubacterium sp. 1001713B170207_170306_E7 TaxID=2787097 RepID=UPI00189A7508|nr:ABC transporter ATP-binding protein/permease [Eubacterium sp. 1001713B170207_170306_E7]
MIDKRLTQMMGKANRYIFLNVFFNWVCLLANMTIIFTIAWLLQNILTGGIESIEISGSLIIIFIALIVRFAATLMASKMSYAASSGVKKTLREKIYKKLLRLGISYNERISTAEVVQVSVEGVEQLDIYFGKYLPQLFYSLLAPITLFAVLSFINLKTALILLICVPLIPVSIVAVQKIAKRLLSKYWSTYTELGDSFLENLQGLTTLKIYEADQYKNEEMNAQSEKFRKITMKVLTMQLNSVTVMDIIAYGGAAIGIILAITEFMKGNISFGGTFALIMLSAEFFIPLRLLGSFFHIAMNGMAASDKIFRLLNLEEPAQADGIVDPQNADIHLRHIAFSYDAERPVLEDVSLSIPKGKFISIVGESGSGKSTIASLIMGAHQSYSGDICIGQQNLKSLSEASIMENITLISHNSMIFKGSVRDNLLIAQPTASDEVLYNTLKRVCLYDFLMEQQGLDTCILENGSNLSGGQSQRLALARALLHNSEIYIFDEATSNIDAESEEQIMSVIEALAHTKTVILISHRLANVRSADQIYVLYKGRIIASGTHPELLENSSYYADLCFTQTSLENYGKEKPVYAQKSHLNHGTAYRAG